MNVPKVNPLICGLCGKEFTSVSVKNRHLRKIHNDDSAKVVKKQHILCSLCTTHDNQETFSTYDHLHDHLRIIHDVLIKQSVLIFKNREEFETWRGKENREVDYVLARTKSMKGETVVNYYCNRSNYRGYESVCSKRNMKVGGSIHIQGICPSRFTVIISKDGSYTVTLVETHVGHDDDLGTKRLSKPQKQLLVKKLATGITTERIIQDDKLERHSTTTTFEDRKKIAQEEFGGFVETLSEDDFEKFMAELKKLKNNIGHTEHISKKRRVEKQSYFSNKK